MEFGKKDNLKMIFLSNSYLVHNTIGLYYTPVLLTVSMYFPCMVLPIHLYFLLMLLIRVCGIIRITIGPSEHGLNKYL